MLEEGSGAKELSTILHALYRVSTFLMRNKNVTEAMQLIIESKRIQSDLAVYINDGVEGDFNFILREFAKFDPGYTSIISLFLTFYFSPPYKYIFLFVLFIFFFF